MKTRLMIIVTGAPGTGKTTLSEELSKRYSIPLVAKDEIKELLFDSLGIGDKQWCCKFSVIQRLKRYMRERLYMILE